MGQPYGFSIADSVLAASAGVTHYDLHTDVNAMIAAADAAVPLAMRLGVEPPSPHLAGLGYVHVSTLGAEVRMGPELMEPQVRPCIHRPEDIDRLAEPDDYLATPLVKRRLELLDELKSRRDDAGDRIGHNYEGPVTTAALLMGPAFFTLPWDDPARAHKLMEFCTRSMIRYTRVLAEHQRRELTGWVGNPDDFAGMFPPAVFRDFVAPYWDMLYTDLGAPPPSPLGGGPSETTPSALGGERRGEGSRRTTRDLHSELLREEHLPFLEQLRIDLFDPSVDPHLPAETLARSCKVPYGLRIWPSQVMSMSADELVALYRHYASFHTRYITFGIGRLEEEPKVRALLDVARELEA